MSNHESAPRRQCPECGWDSEGKPRGSAPYGAKGAPEPDTDEAVAYEYVCGNCGFEWTVHPK